MDGRDICEDCKCIALNNIIKVFYFPIQFFVLELIRVCKKVNLMNLSDTGESSRYVCTGQSAVAPPEYPLV